MSTRPVRMTVNDATVTLDVEPRVFLVDLLRDRLRLTGTNIGCDTSSCGACTVLLDGRSAKSCTVLAVQAEGSAVGTIEGISPLSDAQKIVDAFHDNHALQCGYCTPGMVMATVSLLQENADPSEVEVREALEGNFCRCTGYHNIVVAILDAAQRLKGAT